MNETQIKELRAHAGALVAQGKPLSGVFAWKNRDRSWVMWDAPCVVPDFADGYEWRIAKQKKETNQLVASVL